jgi:hypothetical protein
LFCAALINCLISGSCLLARLVETAAVFLAVEVALSSFDRVACPASAWSGAGLPDGPGPA